MTVAPAVLAISLRVELFSCRLVMHINSYRTMTDLDNTLYDTFQYNHSGVTRIFHLGLVVLLTLTLD